MKRYQNILEVFYEADLEFCLYHLAGDSGDVGSIPGLGRCPGGGRGNPLQYSFLENPLDRGAWHAVVHSISESDMTEAT